MDNYAIADQLSLLSKLMDIHGENAFKAKSYASAAFAIEQFPQEIASLPPGKLFSVKGIGESVGARISELLQTGELPLLQEYLAKTPPGVLDIMNIKGLGPKKIHTLWKEHAIDSVEVLKQFCLDNKLSEIKGFGAKTQQKILEEINYQQQNEGLYLYAQVESFALAFASRLQQHFPQHTSEWTGAFRRQLEVIDRLECVTTIPAEDLKTFLAHQQFGKITQSGNEIEASSEGIIQLHFHLETEGTFYQRLFGTSCSPEFLTAWQQAYGNAPASGEEELFQQAGLPFIPPYLRETPAILEKAKNGALGTPIQPGDVRGLIHSHSNWSDGASTIEQMAHELIALGFEYLVISDHSKAAFYANGLSEQRIREQHRYIDELNARLAPFKIFKSIECDILSDGAMDYSDEVLSTFDLVIASVHSNLQMDEEKAMKRLLGAIANPYVTILGHMTGRLLLKRKGYPVDHKALIDACAEHGVVIEINAHPIRLDMDWRWIEYAREKGVLLSINPDAHTLEEFHNIKYGVLVAQKGGLTKKENLSSMSRKEFEAFLKR
ncbi:helix-hairpin-helix domain-containing protein [Paraflavisolibacter sp. H34]|uniref:helix-hairpin-helix domain-containing protein n=1 Tax=Huijunlia imazamoxiresistens TaxID=3127457 RepID=UPI0030196494